MTQAVEEVWVKSSAQLVHLEVRSCQQPEVASLRLRVSNPVVGVLLDRFDNPSLVLRAQVTDLVKEERVAIGFCEQAICVPSRAGE
jgi:hypothetical protein